MSTPEPKSSPLLQPARPVGFIGYGAYVPRYRIPAKEIARVWAGGKAALPVKEKAVPGMDEDVITMSIEAARNALARAEIHAHQLRAVWVGSESHPYAVKPTSTVVAEAIGAVPNVQAGDWEFACKAGTEAMVAAMGFVGSGMADYPWPSAWTPPRANPAMRWNTPLRLAARPTSLGLPRTRWLPSTHPIPS